MKIYAIMMVKNEVDIVAHVLKSAETWADKIFILDNGSTDGTWELLQSMKNDVITPWKQDFGPYRRGMKADVFNEFRHISNPGDWWCFSLDADEFYVENPREFLEKIPKKYHWVGKKSLDYVITKDDVKKYNFTGNFEHDKDFIKYIKPVCWSEGRFFRYREKLKWDNGLTSQYPMHVGVMAPEKILVKHYQYRSPMQIEARLKNREETRKNPNTSSWKHEPNSLNEALKDANDCVYDEGTLEFYKSLPIRSNLKNQPFKDFIKSILIKLGLYN